METLLTKSSCAHHKKCLQVCPNLGEEAVEGTLVFGVFPDETLSPVHLSCLS